MVQHPPMGMRAAMMMMIRGGGAIQGLRWAARCVCLRFVACLTKTPSPPTESDEELSTLVPRIIVTPSDPSGYIHTCPTKFKGRWSRGEEEVEVR